MRKFFSFVERMRTVWLVSRESKDEPTLEPFSLVYPVDISVEQKCFDLGGACKVKDFFHYMCNTFL